MSRCNWGKAESNEFTQKEIELIKLYETPGVTKREIADNFNSTERAIANKYHSLKKHAKAKGIAWPTTNNPSIPHKSEKKSSVIDKENTYQRVDGNYLYIRMTHTRVKDLNDLIREANVDLSQWRCVDWEATVWEMGAKVVDRDLVYEDGKADGYVKSRGLTVTDLWRVNATFIRTEPVEIAPVIKPVTINFKRRDKVVNIKPDGMKRVLVGSDPQFGFFKSLRTGKLTPFHDRRALDVMLQVAQSHHFEQIVFLGDWLDLADWTDKFIRSPNMYWTTQPAAIESKWWLSQFVDANPDAKVSIIEGNHDKRINDSIMKHMTEAFELKSVDALNLPPLLSVPRIMALHDLNVEWVGPYPDGQVWITETLVCEHGDRVRQGSGATVASIITTAPHSILTGHTHRIEAAFKTVHGKDKISVVQVWGIGSLCRNDGAVPGDKKRQNWQQAFAVVEYFDDGMFNVTPIVIQDGVAIFNSKVYEARDRLPDLISDTAGTNAEWGW